MKTLRLLIVVFAIAVALGLLLTGSLNPLIFVAVLAGVAIGLIVNWVVRVVRRKRNGEAAATRTRAGSTALLAFVGATIVGLASAAVNTLGDDASVQPPVKAEQVEFALDAQLHEQGRERSWAVTTTLNLNSDNLDRILDEIGFVKADKTKKFSDLPAEEKAAAETAVFAAMAAVEFGSSPIDFGKSIGVSHSEVVAIPATGWTPGNWTVRSTLQLPPAIVGELVLLPSSSSTVTIHSPCNAFMQVSPVGTTACVDDQEDRVVPLDAVGSVERTSVTGSFVPKALRYATPLVEFSLKSKLSGSVGFLLGLIPAALGDWLKKLLSKVFEKEAKTAKPTINLETRPEGSADTWIVTVSTAGWKPSESLELEMSKVPAASPTEWETIATATANGLGGTTFEPANVKYSSNEGRQFRARGDQSGLSAAVGVGLKPAN